MDKSIYGKMIIGQKLRELREENGLLLRQVAASLEVDTAYISKLERGEKNIRKEYVIQLANLYNYDENELVAIWLADQLFEVVKEEELVQEAILLLKERLKKQKPQNI